MRSPSLDAFDLSRETDATRKAYGESDFGRGCLVAARLVEKGVRYVEVMLDGWDTHKDTFSRTKKLMGMVDPAMSALLKDLRARNLIESTLVVWMGDFGRTPRINADEGRDHFPQVSSCVVAGAGTRSGIVYGETGADASKVTKDVVSVADLSATLVSAVGMDPHASFLTPVGRPISVTDGGTPIAALLKRCSGARYSRMQRSRADSKSHDSFMHATNIDRALGCTALSTAWHCASVIFVDGRLFLGRAAALHERNAFSHALRVCGSMHRPSGKSKQLSTFGRSQPPAFTFSTAHSTYRLKALGRRRLRKIPHDSRMLPSAAGQPMSLHLRGRTSSSHEIRFASSDDASTAPASGGRSGSTCAVTIRSSPP